MIYCGACRYYRPSEKGDRCAKTLAYVSKDSEACKYYDPELGFTIGENKDD